MTTDPLRAEIERLAREWDEIAKRYEARLPKLPKGSSDRARYDEGAYRLSQCAIEARAALRSTAPSSPPEPEGGGRGVRGYSRDTLAAVDELRERAWRSTSDVRGAWDEFTRQLHRLMRAPPLPADRQEPTEELHARLLMRLMTACSEAGLARAWPVGDKDAVLRDIDAAWCACESDLAALKARRGDK